MMFRFLILILLLLPLSNCSASEQSKKVISVNDITGTWRLVHKSNPFKVFDSVEKTNIQISDLKIIFHTDGKYTLEIIGPKRQAYSASTTIWKISKKKKNNLEVQNLRYYPSELEWAVSNPLITDFNFEFYRRPDSLGLCFPDPDISVCFEKVSDIHDADKSL